jgi:hypothetical protein
VSSCLPRSMRKRSWKAFGDWPVTPAKRRRSVARHGELFSERIYIDALEAMLQCLDCPFDRDIRCDNFRPFQGASRARLGKCCRRSHMRIPKASRTGPRHAALSQVGQASQSTADEINTTGPKRALVADPPPGSDRHQPNRVRNARPSGQVIAGVERQRAPRC